MTERKRHLPVIWKDDLKEQINLEWIVEEEGKGEGGSEEVGSMSQVKRQGQSWG